MGLLLTKGFKKWYRILVFPLRFKQLQKCPLEILIKICSIDFNTLKKCAQNFTLKTSF